MVERDSRDLVREPDPKFIERCGEILGGQVTPEYLQCQVEVGTRVCRNVAEAHEDLRRLRTFEPISARPAASPSA